MRDARMANIGTLEGAGGRYEWKFTAIASELPNEP